MDWYLPILYFLMVYTIGTSSAITQIGNEITNYLTRLLFEALGIRL